MFTGWKQATVATYATKSDDVNAYYFGGDDDGKMVKKAWAYVKPQNDGDDKRWFYFDNTGAAIAEAGVKKINGKFYAFEAPKDYASKMLSGVVALDVTADDVITDATATAKVDLSEWTLADWTAKGYDNVFYFSGDEANDGSLKKNVTFSAEFKDDTYTLAVGNVGALKNGYVSKEKKYYKNGYLLAASEDMRYEVIDVSYNGSKFALLGVSGGEVTSGTVADTDGSYYYVSKATTTDPSVIYKADSSLPSAAKVAAAFKKDGEGAVVKIDGIEYVVSSKDATGFKYLVVTKK